MSTLVGEISNLKVGQSQHFLNLTLFPVFHTETTRFNGPEYAFLDDAIAAGTTRVTELNEGGSVPELRLENVGDRPVLLLDGQELIGAKQNRVLNLTVLAPAKSTIVIPVSCVEAGRWQMASSEFEPADHVMYSQARAARVAQVTNCLRSVGLRRSDQTALWADIRAKASRLNASSRTSAMSAIYEGNAIKVEQYTRAFCWRPEQCGSVFVNSTGAIGIDLFDHPATMQHYYDKLVRSYALDALESAGGEPANTKQSQEFLNRVASAQSFTESAVGLGKDVRLTSDGITGAALQLDNRHVHLCAFTTEASRSFSSRITRASRRR